MGPAAGRPRCIFQLYEDYFFFAAFFFEAFLLVFLAAFFRFAAIRTS